MFRFDENVFRSGGAVKGPFFRERDIFFFAYDDDGRTCFTGRPRYKAVVGNAFTRSSLVTMINSRAS